MLLCGRGVVAAAPQPRPDASAQSCITACKRFGVPCEHLQHAAMLLQQSSSMRTAPAGGLRLTCSRHMA